jgi:hypothetical protein
MDYQEPIQIVHGRVAEVKPGFRDVAIFEGVQQGRNVIRDLENKQEQTFALLFNET